MAKIQIKSEKHTSFGGIFPIMEKFDRILYNTIDSTLGCVAKCLAINRAISVCDNATKKGCTKEITLMHPYSLFIYHGANVCISSMLRMENYSS